MPESSKPVEAASAAPGEKRAASRPSLVKGSESGDPAVQKLLADRWTAQQNSDKDAEKQADAALADLGYE